MKPNHKLMNEKTLDLVAERFRILGDPTRLRILQTLSGGEMAVADLVAATGAAQANVSKHLQLLLRAGLVRRRKEGLRVYYDVADPQVFRLCDLVCGSLADRLSRDLEALEPGAGGKRSRAGRRRS
ncbi:MAG: metalloregulator ArsR/SmtB family transcription factor [Candidatus Latescibacteria bacterium]|nr:metalloregulator ArsR/SmtB family transcription factor [Candidatus Latescibacterota bacterium]